MEKFEVGIVLVNYNSVEDTVACIQSIQLSDGDLPYIVVVENNSGDQKVIKEKVDFYPFIKVLITNDNIGFGRANNLGINWLKDNVHCKYLFLLNNDTIVEKDTLKQLTSAFERSGADTGMAAPKILVYGKQPVEIWYEGATINYKKMTPDIGQRDDRYTEFASGCAMFFDAEVLYGLKGFDPFFFMYDEDVELSMRLLKSGKKIRYVENAVIHHKCQGSQTKEKDIPANQLHPNHPGLLFYLKNTILNRKYIINKHLDGQEQKDAIYWQKKYWLMKSVQFLLYGKVSAFYSVLKYLFRRVSV